MTRAVLLRAPQDTGFMQKTFVYSEAVLSDRQDCFFPFRCQPPVAAPHTNYQQKHDNLCGLISAMLRLLEIRQYSLWASPRLTKIILANLCLISIENSYKSKIAMTFQYKNSARQPKTGGRCAVSAIAVRPIK